jgi:hypothetical protein
VSGTNLISGATGYIGKLIAKAAADSCRATTCRPRARRYGKGPRFATVQNSVSSMSRIFAVRLVVATALAVMALSVLFATLRILK